MSPEKHLIATLPLTPGLSEEKELSFSYPVEKKLGTFFYGDRALLIAYEKVKYYAGNRGTSKSEKKRPRSRKIPAQSWAENFSDPPLIAGEPYEHREDSGPVHESHTQKRFSGFEFDAEAEVWKGSWKWDHYWSWYNSGYFDRLEICLELNLARGTGKYFEKESIDRTD